MTTSNVPHSVANPGQGARLVAPSASRNTEPLCALLSQVAPRQGRALEIASGTGQHVAAFAAHLPDLHWQPSDPDPARRASINARALDTGLTTIAPAIALDAGQPGWSTGHPDMDLIVVINLLHLIPMAAVETALHEAALALAPGGRFVIYGPFMRGGELTSPGDKTFHDSLQAENPAIGYKDDFDIMDLLQSAGLAMAEVIEMPANNLALIAEKPKT